MNSEHDPLAILGNVKLTKKTKIVYARATYYPDKIKVFQPLRPYSKGFELPPNRTSLRLGIATDEDKERSINRTRSTIRDYALCNRFNLFATFTFKKDRDDVNKCKTKMSNWLKNQTKRYGKFEYLIVPEFHKDGKSIHFHALLKDYPGKLTEARNPKTGRPVTANGQPVYTFASYTLGFSNVMKIKDTPDDYAKVANYVRKYITKDMPVFLNKNRFWVSHGLKTPIYEENPEWYKKARPYWSKITNHGTVFLYDRDAGIMPKGLWE